MLITATLLTIKYCLILKIKTVLLDSIILSKNKINLQFNMIHIIDLNFIYN